jgi:hypothetical protein
LGGLTQLTQSASPTRTGSTAIEDSVRPPRELVELLLGRASR